MAPPLTLRARRAKSPTSCDVALVTQFYWPEPVGIACYTADLAQALAKCPDWCVGVLTGEPYYPAFDKYDDYRRRVRVEIVNGVRVDRVWTLVPRPASLSSRLLSELNFAIQGTTALLRRRTGRRPLVVSFAPGISSALVGNLMRARTGRHITIVHDVSSGLAASTGLTAGSRINALLRRIEAAVLNRSDVVVALSQQMAEVLRDIGVTTRIEVVPLWVRGTSTEAPLPLPAGPPTVLYSGSFARKHGLLRLLPLAAELEVSAPEARLRIQGEGPLETHLKEQVSLQGIRNVELAPLVGESELAASLATGRVHVVPQEPDSAAFAVPSKVYSSLAIGRPVVATARAGSPLHDLSLRCPALTCVDPDVPEEFHRAVLERLTDGDLYAREAQAACEYIRRHHDRERLIEQLIELLLETRQSVGTGATKYRRNRPHQNI